MKKTMVLGLILSQASQQVLLVRKKSQQWPSLDMKLNGVGGSCQDGETPLDALQRTTLAQTGLTIGKDTWKPIGHFQGSDDQYGVLVAVANLTPEQLSKMLSLTEEQVMLYDIEQVMSKDGVNAPHLRTLLSHAVRPMNMAIGMMNRDEGMDTAIEIMWNRQHEAPNNTENDGAGQEYELTQQDINMLSEKTLDQINAVAKAICLTAMRLDVGAIAVIPAGTSFQSYVDSTIAGMQSTSNEGSASTDPTVYSVDTSYQLSQADVDAYHPVLNNVLMASGDVVTIPAGMTAHDYLTSLMVTTPAPESQESLNGGSENNAGGVNFNNSDIPVSQSLPGENPQADGSENPSADETASQQYVEGNSTTKTKPSKK